MVDGEPISITKDFKAHADQMLIQLDSLLVELETNVSQLNKSVFELEDKLTSIVNNKTKAE